MSNIGGIKKMKKNNKKSKVEEVIIDYLYHSNMIEEIHIDRKEYYDTIYSIYPEISGHALALEYVSKHFKEDMSIKHILNIHKLLTKGLVDDKYCGKFRDIPVYIGGHEALHPIALKDAMNNFVYKCNNIKLNEKTIWDLHNNYERVHPFTDGNGRSGRLLLQYFRLHIGLPLLIVSSEYGERMKYYQQISCTPFDLFEEEWDQRE
jgi:fido (protein-threonine AMPylation protein)